MVEWSLAALRAAEPVRSLVVACPPGHVHELGGRDLAVVEGGETRSASVSSALEAVGTELVAIHDAARPLLTPELVEAVVAALVADPQADGAIAAAPVADTIKRAASGEGAEGLADAPDRTSSDRVMTLPPYRVVNASLVVEGTVDRGRLWAAQTPQVFRAEALRKALAADPARVAAATDEAMLVEAAGGKVLIHPTSPENLKVTTQLDLRMAELLLEARSAK